VEALQTGHFWKTPFVWEPGCAEPADSAKLEFEVAPKNWLLLAIADVMAASPDPSDHYAVEQFGPAGAAADLLSVAPRYFTWQERWWRLGRDRNGERVGFVLPVVFKDGEGSKNGQPQGTILYMGVLPKYRGRGYSHELLAEATRVFRGARCWQIFCDTATENRPMVSAFRRAGYQERAPWQRPVA